MPTLRLGSDFEMHYEVDDFTDPWKASEAILLLHGNCESSAAWFSWVPHLARHLRIVRPDLRGYGRSTPVPRDFAWSMALVIDDFMALMRTLGIARFHLVGAKIGGFIARCFAARYPYRYSMLITVSGRLLAEEWVTEAELAKLGPEKLELIKRAAMWK